ncbi:PREDICTED: uncharacterized protein LOC101806841 [Ficedula albicollis]|uniref:uncharacterized protein LOC101806841 n=1 Tax=Ficedula albicollis TaxID=59894 RepID=UPI0003598A1F|nr:PREDICTED: uncharacterized protein LOC101806841 [Ficedula albicollis]
MLSHPAPYSESIPVTLLVTRPLTLSSVLSCCLDVAIHPCRMSVFVPMKVQCHSMEVGWSSVGDGVGQGPHSEVWLPVQAATDTEEMEVDIKIDVEENIEADVDNGEEEMEVELELGVEEMEEEMYEGMDVDVEEMEEEMEVEMEDYAEDMEVDEKGEQEDIVLGWTPTPGRCWPCPARRQSGSPAARLGLGWWPGDRGQGHGAWGWPWVLVARAAPLACPVLALGHALGATAGGSPQPQPGQCWQQSPAVPACASLGAQGTALCA